MSLEQLLLVGIILVAVYVCFFLQIIIHEAGHLIGGLLSGYQFNSFRILCFMWLTENGKFKLRRLSIVGTGGQCLMAPPDMKNGEIPVMLYNLGGVLMNGIVSVIFLIIGIDNKESLWGILWILMALEGVILALMNGIPLEMGGITNDGYNAFSSAKNKEAMRAFWVQMKISDQQTKGVRLKDMPEEWFEVPNDLSMKNGMISCVGVFAYNRLMDEGKLEEAEKLMKHMLEIESGIIGLHRNLLIGDQIYLELVGENRKDILDSLSTKEWKKFQTQMKNFPSVLRTQYAYAMLHENDMEKAEKFRVQFEKVCKTYPYQSDIQSERELMKLVAQKNGNS